MAREAIVKLKTSTNRQITNRNVIIDTRQTHAQIMELSTKIAVALSIRKLKRNVTKPMHVIMDQLQLSTITLILHRAPIQALQ